MAKISFARCRKDLTTKYIPTPTTTTMSTKALQIRPSKETLLARWANQEARWVWPTRNWANGMASFLLGPAFGQIRANVNREWELGIARWLDGQSEHGSRSLWTNIWHEWVTVTKQEEVADSVVMSSAVAGKMTSVSIPSLVNMTASWHKVKSSFYSAWIFQCFLDIWCI